LEQSPELLAEPIQTILKTVGVADPYDLLKKATRGQKVTQALLMNLVNGLDIPQAIKERIAALSPVSYVGDAVRICERVLQHYRALLA
jgi:adenylosuccinate lyase